MTNSLKTLIVIIFVALMALVVGYLIPAAQRVKLNTQEIVSIKEDKTDHSADEDVALHMIKIGALRWMRMCSYSAGREGRSAADAEKACQPTDAFTRIENELLKKNDPDKAETIETEEAEGVKDESFEQSLFGGLPK